MPISEPLQVLAPPVNRSVPMHAHEHRDNCVQRYRFSLPSRHISGPQTLRAAVCFDVLTRVYEFLHERLVQSSHLLRSFSMEVNQPLVGIDPDNQRGSRVIETLRQFIQWGA